MRRAARPPRAAVALAAAIALAPVAAVSQERPRPAGLVCDRLIEDFSASAPGEFPSGWRTKHPHNAAEAREARIYVVETVDGVPALHATYGTHTITVVRGLPRWDLAEYPVLAWRWKAVHLPAGADESDADRNDSAASVYLVWKIGFPHRIADVRYAWSTTLPVGRTVVKRFGRERVVVAESGPADEWRDAHVDLLAQARALLREETPPSPAFVALTTDADATASSAEAYYAEFRLCRREGDAPARRSAALGREGG